MSVSGHRAYNIIHYSTVFNKTIASAMVQPGQASGIQQVTSSSEIKYFGKNPDTIHLVLKAKYFFLPVWPRNYAVLGESLKSLNRVTFVLASILLFLFHNSNFAGKLHNCSKAKWPDQNQKCFIRGESRERSNWWNRILLHLTFTSHFWPGKSPTQSRCV